MRLSAFLALSAASLTLAACGGDDEDKETEKAASPAVALKEAGETKAAITAALASYTAGDAAKAEEQVAEAYVSHFEEVEHALEERDEALNERLEESISGDLRQAIKAKDDAKVAKLGREIVADLTKAEAALR
jgi:ABC-type glycerol-3-phosphate transport system substrate-binding protein